MRKKNNVIVLSLLVILIVFWTLSITGLQFNFQTSYVKSKELEYRNKSVDFLQSWLWDHNYSSFYGYRFDNGSFTENGVAKYTSFNIWAARALLSYSIASGDNSSFDNYGLKALHFILTNSQNKTNGGFYHWVERNGSLPEVSDYRFNNSIYQIGTYQAWVLISLMEVYKFTKNATYINIWGKEVADFLINYLWDDIYGGFYESFNPFYNLIVKPYKYTWYQAWPALALLEYYEITSNITYLSYANNAINFILENLWDNQFKAFFDNATEDGTISQTARFTLTDQAAAVLVLLKNYKITGNISILNNYLLPIINFVKANLWNNFLKQFYSACELDGTKASSLIRPSDLSIWLYSLYSARDFLSDDILEIYLISSILHMNHFGWDEVRQAFFRKFDQNGTTLDLSKWTIEQAIPLFLFSHFLPEPNYIQSYVFLSIFLSTFGILIITSYRFKKKREITRHKIN